MIFQEIVLLNTLLIKRVRRSIEHIEYGIIEEYKHISNIRTERIVEILQPTVK